MSKTVYIAGPYTQGDVAVNVRHAILAGEELLYAGFVPFIPHLTHFWHLLFPHQIDFWYKYDLEWLERCDYLLRLPGDSPGATVEVGHAEAFGIPVYYSIGDLIRAL